jgi:hypothetical protein
VPVPVAVLVELEVTVYSGEVRAEFPICEDVRFVNATDTTPDVPPEADTPVTLAGAEVGVTAADASEAGDVPIALVAVTVKV